MKQRARSLRSLLAAQFLGAFNDNAWKLMVILLLERQLRSPDEGDLQQTAKLGFIVLTIPLVLFSLPAGWLADRVSKRTVVIVMKWLELVLMTGGLLLLAWLPGASWALLLVLGLMGLQSALFGPAKYGIVPELVPHSRISMANGLLGMWTFFAIIAGTVLGPILLEQSGGRPWIASIVLVSLSVAGIGFAHRIRPLPPARTAGGFGETVSGAWKAMRAEPALWLAACGSAAFWAVSSLLGQNVLVYARSVLGLEEQWRAIPLGIYAVGIGIGSLFAGRISGDKVETGLIPLGAAGLAALTLLTGFTEPGRAGLGAIMALLGVFSGFVLVPLDSLLQWLAPVDRRGAVISLANVLAFGGMLAGSLLGGELADFGLSTTAIWTAAGVLTLLGTVWALWALPVAFLRLLVFLYTHTLYRVKVRGAVHVPASGGALLTPNHVSYMDGLLLIAALDRPVRFVIEEEQYNRPFFRPVLKMAGAIPVSSKGGPKVILKALRAAADALDEGELVCIFPEGQITRTGAMLAWRRGFERILKGRDVPILPVHLDRVWGSAFSHGRRQGPREFPHKVTVSFGAPLPADTPLHRVRQAVVDLGCEAWDQRKEDAETLHRRFLSSVRRGPWKPALVDGKQGAVSRLSAAAGAVALARRLRPHWKGQERVGILLPASGAAAMVNAAAALAGRASVNLNFTTGVESPIRQAGLRTVVTVPRFVDKLPEDVTPVLLGNVVPLIGRGARFVAAFAALLWPKRWVERYCGADGRPQLDDVATILFSSGSTGEPKGAMLTHWNLASNVEGLAQVMRLQRDDRVLNVLPPFHSFGTMLTWFGLTQGVPQVLHPDPTDARAIGALVEAQRATIALATPTFLQLWIRRVPPEQFGSLRLVVAGAEKLRERVAEAFEDRFGVRPLEGYGATECSPVIAVSLPSFREAGFFQQGARRGSVGLPLPGVTLRVIDPATREETAPGEPGLLLVQGPNVMKGYLGREPVGPWYETGDIARIDHDGFVYLTDRLSRFSKIGGEMVPHGKVEEALEEAFGKPGARHFLVAGVPDEKQGERLAVLHTVDEAELPDLLIRLKERGLPNLFLPRLDAFRKVDEIPLLGSGKVDLKNAKSMAGSS